jgi:SAM-dependent methyltransferase
VTNWQTADTLAGWQAVAPGWEKRRAFVWGVSHEVGERLVDALDPQPGETILELACGPGDTGFMAATRLGRTGRLISTDFSAEMVAAATRRAQELGLGNVEHRVVDGQAIDLPDASVDGVVCRWGYMLMPDPARALGETWRVLRPGGRLAFSIWADAGANPWGSAITRAAIELGFVGPPEPDAPGPFRLGDPDRVRALVADAGFEPAEITDVPVTWRYVDFAEYWAVSSDLSSSLNALLQRLTAAEFAEAQERVETILQEYVSADGLALPGVTRNVLTRKSGS